MSALHVLRWVGGQSFVSSPVTGAPTLLRFDSDDFMDRLLATLADAPQTLPDFIARPESWQQLAAPTPAPAIEAPKSAAAKAMTRQRSLLGFRREPLPAPPPAPEPKLALKLFQPVHQRFYVAAAHLVCELPGLPNRNTASGDKSGMLLRRVMPNGSEAAFVKLPGQPGRWHPLANASQPLPGEEWLSVFPLAYTAPGGQPRRMLAGLVPAARHDDFRFASQVPATPPTLADDLKASAQTTFIAPWQGLIERARATRDAAGQPVANAPWDDDPGARENAAKLSLPIANDQLQESSWRLLQDMVEWLAAHLPEVYARLGGGTVLRPQAQHLLDVLQQASFDAVRRAEPAFLNVFSLNVLPPKRATTTVTHLRAALAAIVSASLALDGASLAFPKPDAGPSPWPAFAFPLAVATAAGRLEGPFTIWPGAGDDIQDEANDRLKALQDALNAAIDEADAAGVLGAARSQAPDAARLARELQATLAADAGPPRYVLRFVHQRCDCGPLHPAVMSDPSEVFELAGFFDTDAPLRPIRIALPFDTSPGGLRKFGKNSAFIMSDLLCGQMKRVRRLGFGDLVLSVLPWPFHKDLSVPDGGPCGSGGTAPTFGTICSLSIPIITIVAFILLIVIATLLDLIFRWLPFLMVCFPVPGLKGKKP
jgi:hypothetical protein